MRPRKLDGEKDSFTSLEKRQEAHRRVSSFKFGVTEANKVVR
jgi:hypothetical protein